MTVSKMDHAMLSFAFLGSLSAPARRNDKRPPKAVTAKDAKRSER
jgi:hypothetical protein